MKKFSGDMTNIMKVKAESQSLTLSEAVELMRGEAFLRPVRETLAKACGKTEYTVQQLKLYLRNLIQEADPDESADNIRNTVGGWMGDEKYSIKREWSLKLAVMFGLNVDDAEEFMVRTCQDSLHWRDPRDIVYIYALQKKLSLRETLGLQAELAADPDALLAVQEAEPASNARTKQVAAGVRTISTADELKTFLRDNKGSLGAFHNTAYEMFMDYLEALGWTEQGEKEQAEREKAQADKKKDAGKEKSKNKSKRKSKDEGSDEPVLNEYGMPKEYVTARSIVETHLFGKIVPRVKRAVSRRQAEPQVVLSALQRELRKGIPDETEFSKMIHRRQDVNRKVLMLMFLATDGEVSPGRGRTNENTEAQRKMDLAYSEMIASETEEAMIEDRYERMNNMLNLCGYHEIDPRNRFDWICLYSMCAGEEYEAYLVDGSMQRFMAELFEKNVDDMLTGYSDGDYKDGDREKAPEAGRAVAAPESALRSDPDSYFKRKMEEILRKIRREDQAVREENRRLLQEQAKRKNQEKKPGK